MKRARSLYKSIISIVLVICIMMPVSDSPIIGITATSVIPISKGAFKYEPKKWKKSKDFYTATNCYAYALNLFKDPIKKAKYSKKNNIRGVEPGDFNIIMNYKSLLEVGVTKSEIDKRVKADMSSIGYKISSVSGKKLKKKINSKKTSLIYMATTSTRKTYEYYDPSKNRWVVSVADYHWYRQDSNGYWSHKRGKTKLVSNKDQKKKKIKRPDKAAKKYVSKVKNDDIGGYLFYDINGIVYTIENETNYDGDGGFYMVTRK